MSESKINMNKLLKLSLVIIYVFGFPALISGITYYTLSEKNDVSVAASLVIYAIIFIIITFGFEKELYKFITDENK